MLSTVLFYVLLFSAWATVALWLAANFAARRELAIIRFSAGSNDFAPLLIKPSVSILLPARNEEKRILRQSVNSLLGQNYENLEIIAVNDRSTDKTGEILDELAGRNERLRAIAGAQLPAGWLGKPFVLQQAFESAGGEWILTVDADVELAAEAVETALKYVYEKRLDAVCLIPFVECKTFWERVFIPTFNWFRMLAMPPSRVNDQSKPNAMGIGNFFLVRRSALNAISGFETVKTDVAEDLRLAALLKQNRFKIETVYAPGLLKTRMYTGFREIWRGFTKNFFAGSNFSAANSVSGVVSIILFGVLPVISGFALLIFAFVAQQIFGLWLGLPFVLTYILQIALFFRLNREYEQPLRYALCAPLGLGLFAAILTNSTVKVLSGSGVSWKDREIYKNGDLPISS